MLAQCNDEGKEHALYYISRKMVGAEVNYSSMERFAFCLGFRCSKVTTLLLVPSDHFNLKGRSIKIYII